jgi:hypothetical protein
MVTTWIQNYRTTSIGVLLFLLAGYEFVTGGCVDHIPFDPLAHWLMACGFVFAKDADVTNVFFHAGGIKK